MAALVPELALGPQVEVREPGTPLRLVGRNPRLPVQLAVHIAEPHSANIKAIQQISPVQEKPGSIRGV